MIASIITRIRSRSSSEWKTFFANKLLHFRIFAQENGEKVFLLGLLAGVVVVLFYKLFIFLGAVAALAYLLILLIADQGPGSDSGAPRM